MNGNPLSDVQAFLDAGNSALQLLKNAANFLPRGEKRDQAEHDIGKAEEAIKASKAALAQELGYRLCRCEFPPNPMLWDKDRLVSVCPSCSDYFPREPEVVRQPPRGHGGWAG